MNVAVSKILSYIILAIVSLTLSFVALLLLPIVVFMLLLIPVFIASIYIVRRLFYKKTFPPNKDGMRSTDDEELTKTLETLQKKNKGN